MRILFVAPLYWPDNSGATRLLQGYAENLALRGHAVTVWTTNAAENRYLYFQSGHSVSERRTIHNEVRIIRYPIWHPANKEERFDRASRLPFRGSGDIFDDPRVVSMKLQMAARVLSANYDLVIAGYLPFTSFLHAATIIARRCKCPLVFVSLLHIGEIEDDTFLATFGRPRQRRLLQRADLLLANTEIERNALLRWGIPADRVAVVGAGIDPLQVRGGIGRRFRDLYGLTEPVVFQLSTQTHDKGSHHLVEAMKLVWAQGLDAHLVLCGKVLADFDDYLAHQEKYVFERVLVLGGVTEQRKNDLLAAGDIMVMLSRAESFGIAFLEAWWYGKAVVGCYAGSLPALIQDGKDGLLVPFADVHMLAETIVLLLKNDDLRKVLGSTGHVKVRTSYLWDQRIGLLGRALGRLMNGKPI